MLQYSIIPTVSAFQLVRCPAAFITLLKLSKPKRIICCRTRFWSHPRGPGVKVQLYSRAELQTCHVYREGSLPLGVSRRRPGRRQLWWSFWTAVRRQHGGRAKGGGRERWSSGGGARGTRLCAPATTARSSPKPSDVIQPRMMPPPPSLFTAPRFHAGCTHARARVRV